MTTTEERARVNERGCTVTSRYAPLGRYHFDFKVCTSAKGWEQYDTTQDAAYFGIWVHIPDRKIVTYCEGDLITVECPNDDAMRAELAHMEAFYGPPPPACVSYNTDGTVVTTPGTRPSI